eukprot:m51a1_g10995 hypothetical protein (568) ;mRNA; r:339765-341930
MEGPASIDDAGAQSAPEGDQHDGNTDEPMPRIVRSRPPPVPRREAGAPPPLPRNPSAPPLDSPPLLPADHMSTPLPMTVSPLGQPRQSVSMSLSPAMRPLPVPPQRRSSARHLKTASTLRGTYGTTRKPPTAFATLRREHAGAVAPVPAGPRLERTASAMQLSDLMAQLSSTAPGQLEDAGGEGGPKRPPREMAINELLTTERVYIENLTNFISTYVEPLKQIIPEEHGRIFGKIESLLCVNIELLRTLESGESIGRCFLDISDYLKVYTFYCCSYDQRQTKFIDKIRQTNPQFDKFMAEVRGGVEEMSSQFIRPVQRICKYPLLLKEIAKYSDPGPERDELELAVVKILAVCETIDRRKSVVDRGMKTADVQSLLVSKSGRPVSILSPTRELLKEGAVSQRAAISTKSSFQSVRYYLFNDMLLRATTSRFSKKLQLLGRSLLENVNVQLLDGLSKSTFHVESRYAMLLTAIDIVDGDDEDATGDISDIVLVFFTDAERMGWYDAIQAAITARDLHIEELRARSTRAKEKQREKEIEEKAKAGAEKKEAEKDPSPDKVEPSPSAPSQ